MAIALAIAIDVHNAPPAQTQYPGCCVNCDGAMVTTYSMTCLAFFASFFGW